MFIKIINDLFIKNSKIINGRKYIKINRKTLKFYDLYR